MIKKILPLILIFSIIIVFTLVAFFLMSVELSAINVWALIFIVISELAAFSLFTYLRITKKSIDNVFLKSGTIMSVSIYLIATLTFGIIAIILMNNLNIFFLIQIAIISLFAIVMILLFSFSDRISKRNSEDINKADIREPKRGGL